MEAVTVQSLPAEVLEHVFRQLEPNNLKTVVLVCKRWRDIGEAPKLWTWVYHWVNRGNLANMPRILASKRLRALRMIAVRSFSEDLLRAIIKHPSIQELDLTDADWSLSTIVLAACLLYHSVSLPRITLTRQTQRCLYSS